MEAMLPDGIMNFGAHLTLKPIHIEFSETIAIEHLFLDWKKLTVPHHITQY